MNNFTPRAQQVLALARKEADRFNHNYVGTEHLLLGIMREEHGYASELLRVMSIPGLAEVRKSISESPVRDEVRPGRSSGPIRYSPPMKLVEEQSGKELLARLPFQTVPRIGDAVLLTGSEENVGEYRIVDVRWGIHLKAQGDESVLNEIEIRVRREELDKR